MIHEEGPSGRLKRQRTLHAWRVSLLAGGLLMLALFSCGLLWIHDSASVPRTAPEAEKVLSAQTEMPFQVLIPAFLPGQFNRDQIKIDTSQSSLDGAPLIQLSYPAHYGNTLILSEWFPKVQVLSGITPGQTSLTQPQYIRCWCRSRTQCEMSEVEVAVGGLHVLIKSTNPGVVSAQEMQLIINTLGPASNRQVYSSAKEVPVTYSLPPAIDIPINADGKQEVALVVTPQGYTPAHFAVKRGVPVRLIFRQIGYVGCGNELIFQWGKDHSAHLILTSTSDVQIVEFTPEESGDFQFNCPHLIYRGAMTVKD